MKKKIKEILKEGIKVTTELSDDSDAIETISKIINDIISCLRKGGRVIVFGNGGSAADSQHLACELVGKFKKERRPIGTIALTTNTSTLTAIGNDYGFENTFFRQVSALATKEDVVIAISTSGNSPNVLKGVEEANRIKALTIGLTGKDGGKLKTLCKHCVCVPSYFTPRIQEVHIKVIHIIAELVEEVLCK